MSDSPLRPSIAADLGSLAGAFTSAPSPGHELSAGTIVGGHFVIETTLGKGGMGAVYRAHDRQLDRKVAIKLGLRGADLARARREAVALARLAHPNVVTIHEIGEHDGVPFVAMELCEGGTVRAWARSSPRTWREILAVFLDAGRGLAAAHAAGLVHRDVKPDNILLGIDGRARIADFGLARGAQGLVGGSHSGVRPSPDAQAETAAPGPTERSVVDAEAPTVGVSSPTDPDSTLTADGAIVGTPRYMAPEQADGRPLDARTDEYSFCVALKETLGDTTPRRVVAIVERGCSDEPSRRYPTMDALIAALERASRRRKWWIAPAVLTVVAALAITWWLARDATAPPPGCGPAAARIKGVWDPSLRAEVAARSSKLGSFVDAMDRRIGSWTAARTETCREIGRGGEAAAAGFARLHCLDQRLADLGALVTYVRTAQDVSGAFELSTKLPSIDACKDPRDISLRAPEPDSPQLRQQVIIHRGQVRVAYALGNSGDFDEALATIDAIPRGLFPPLDADVDLVRADVLGEKGEVEASRVAYRSAIKIAAASHYPEVQIEALLDLAYTLALEGDELDERSRNEVNGMFELAEATLASVGGDANLAAHLHGNRAAVRAEFGDLEGAVADAREALRLRRAHDGPRAGVTINAALNLGAALLSAGHHREAYDVLVPALADAEATLHPNHTIVRSLVDLLSTANLKLGDLPAARALRERALQMAEATTGPESTDADLQRLNLTSLLAAEGNFAEGIPLIEATLANLHRRGDDKSATVAMLRGNLAMSLSITGRNAEALAQSEQSVALFEHAFGTDHPALVDAFVSRAMILYDAGDKARAIESARRAVSMAERTLSPTSPELANPLGTLAMIIAETSPAEARRHAERARTLAAPPDGNPAVRGEAELALAMSLARLDQRARALALGEQAIATLTEAGPMAGPSRKRAEAWLAAERAR